MKMERVNIKELRKQCNTDNCEVKYYTDFEFLDIYEEPNKIRKKSISAEKISTDEYTVGYFRDGRLIRLDLKSKKSDISYAETYMLYENGLVSEVYSFTNSKPSLNLFLKKPTLLASYKYKYDNKGRMLQNTWKHLIEYGYPTQKFITQIILDYEYDDEGLIYIYKTFSSETNKVPERFTLYDREKEKYIKQFTVTKSTLIEHKARTNDGTVDFENKSRYNTKTCPHCSGTLSHILTLDLQNIRSLNKTGATTKLPVLFCFDCLANQTYTENELNLPSSKQPFIKNAAYKFSGTADEEKSEKAFIKIGGIPEWIQNDDHPICPVCKKPMVYTMTLSSREEHNNGKDSLTFGDRGKLYVFNCCGHTTVVMQCY